MQAQMRTHKNEAVIYFPFIHFFDTDFDWGGGEDEKKTDMTKARTIA